MDALRNETGAACESIPCRACRSKRTERLFVVQNLKVRRCSDCTHVFLDVVHTGTSIKSLYEDYGNTSRDFYFDGAKTEEVRKNTDSYLERCREYSVKATKELLLLDIGSGSGALIDRAQKQGFICEGIEICKGLAESAGQILGCPIHTGFLAESNLPSDHFDVITMYDLIEHVPDPMEDLIHCHRLLAPGGILFILTPNNGALLRRISRLAYLCTFHAFQKPLSALYYRDHLSYFSAQSLSGIVQKAGFNVLELETRNQEMSRLTLSAFQKLAVRIIFGLADHLPSSGGKLILWAQKVPVPAER
jgi:2-polyprenyl-3-methyl-5-hydroxy-6-metoxy-1,4-benzoquinol methylase